MVSANDDPAMGIRFDKRVRTNMAGDTVLPCAMALVVKKVTGFDTQAASVDVRGTLIIRIKINGMHDNEELVDFLKNDLKMRINETEVSVKEELGAKVVMSSSMDAPDKSVKDIVQYTIRFDQKAETGDGEYA